MVNIQQANRQHALYAQQFADDTLGEPVAIKCLFCKNDFTTRARPLPKTCASCTYGMVQRAARDGL